MKHKVDTQKYLRGSIRDAKEKAQETPDEWFSLELSNKEDTRHLTIEVKVTNGKALYRVLGIETYNQSRVYELARRELDVEKWSS